MYYIAPIPKQFMDSSGVPYRNGTVEVFLNGDTRHAPVYADCDGTAQVENPFVLDSHGFWNAFVEPGVLLDYVVRDENNNVIFSFYGVKIDALGNISHDSTLVGTGDRARPLGISPSVLEALHQEVQSEAAARAEGDAETLAAANSYTNESVASHNVNPDAHPDIRQAIVDEAAARDEADGEIINSLEDETAARRINDQLLEQQIAEVAVQTDWNEDDSSSLAYLRNRPPAISTLEIEALFI